MEVLTADREQSQLPHKLFILRAAVLGVNEVEFLDIRGILDDTAQFALGCRRFFIAHIHPNALLPELLVHDAAILIAAVVALPANHMRVVLFQCSKNDGPRDRLILGIEDDILDVDILSIPM